MPCLMFDLDGTLLYENSAITDRVKRALCLAKEHGMRLGIATGRPISTVEKMIARWGLQGVITMVVGMNGTHVKELTGGLFEHGPLIPAQAMDAIVTRFADLPCEIAISDEEHLYAAQKTYYIRWIEANDQLTYVHTNFDQERRQAWPKVAVIADPDRLNDVAKRYQEYEWPDVVGHIASDYTLEFTHREANKGAGIRLLCNRLGIDCADVIAFGDANNDLSMFEVCGTAICMANGTAAAKQMADRIIPSNRDDGVAVYIEEWIRRMER